MAELRAAVTNFWQYRWHDLETACEREEGQRQEIAELKE